MNAGGFIVWSEAKSNLEAIWLLHSFRGREIVLLDAQDESGVCVGGHHFEKCHEVGEGNEWAKDVHEGATARLVADFSTGEAELDLWTEGVFS